jgi:hypothetical protein
MKTRPEDWQSTPKQAGIFANHGKVCSCWMCGNPRRYLGEQTIQERRQKLVDAHSIQKLLGL